MCAGITVLASASHHSVLLIWILLHLYLELGLDSVGLPLLSGSDPSLRGPRCQLQQGELCGLLKSVSWVIQASKRGDRREAAAQQVVRLVSNSMPVSFSHNAMLYNPSKQRIAYLSAVDQEFWNLEFLTEKIIHMGKVRLPTYTAFQECHGMIMLDKRLISKSSCRHGPLFKLTFVQHLPSVNPTWWRFGTRLVQYSTTPDMLFHHHSTCGITLSCC
jgi:hypothetical protein